MKPNRKLIPLLILNLVGVGISLYQTWHYFALRAGAVGFNSFCNFNEKANCEIIETSKYAELIPGMPLASFASGWFIIVSILILTALMSDRPSKWIRTGTLFTLVGSLFSSIYLVIMFGIIKVACVLCLCVDAVNFSSLALWFSLKPLDRSAPNASPAREWLRTAFLAGVGALALSFLFAKGLGGNAAISKSDKMDALESILITTKPIDVKIDTPLVQGPADAPVTIVKFSDFQCPHCQKGAFALHPALMARAGKVKFVLRNFPLDGACNRVITSSMHLAACEAARAVICGGKQGQFEKAYETLFENAEVLAPGKAVPFLVAVGLDEAKLTACLTAPETTDQLSRDIEEGIRLGIQSTPTFFINGRKVEGGVPSEVWIELIDRLSAGK